MSSPLPTIVWLRQDLRMANNPALTAACRRGGPVVLLYVLDESPGLRPPGAASRWWLGKSLASLGRDIGERGGRLTLRRGDPAAVLREIVEETGAGAVFWNRLYDKASIDRDTRIKQAFRDRGVECRSFNASLLNEPWDIQTGSGGPYKVFSAYWRAAAPRVAAEEPDSSPCALTGPERQPPGDRLADWGLHPQTPDWSRGFGDWTPGEAGAHARLSRFLDEAAGDYAEGRDRPGLEATSRLSPHLHFGEIGPRQVWSATRAALETLPSSKTASRKGLDTFLKELGWREFNYQLLYHFPRTQDHNLNPKFDDFAWRKDARALKAWRTGRTGYPIVDAGMRQLWETGWMHNRVRMIAASFLVKDLLIHWKTGEAWFWDTLVDADLANNVGGWQWVAGSGADAAPYFRVFNPVLQGQRFDPNGDYVRRWVPELAKLPDACIHAPWTAGESDLAAAEVRLGATYPSPIVDHAMARDRALSLYERLQ